MDESIDVVPFLSHRRQEVTAVVGVGQPAGDGGAGRGDGAGDDPAHGGGPQHTKTGFSACSRTAPVRARSARPG